METELFSLDTAEDRAATRQFVLALAEELNKNNIPYTLEADAALFVHAIDGADASVAVDLPEVLDALAVQHVTVSIQWDQFDLTYDLFRPYVSEPALKTSEAVQFSFTRSGYTVRMTGYYNTVIVTDPHRVPVTLDGHTLWCKSLEFLKWHFRSDNLYLGKIHELLRIKQRELNHFNARSWTQDAYQAWVNRFGTPHMAAEQIQRNPAGRLKSLERFLDDVSGMKVANLLGSHGGKAVALALLGADVTVVDLSPENARYATEVASAAGVNLRYVVSDVLSLPESELTSDYDLVLMELGILHYFVDLAPLANQVAKLLRFGGKLVLQDFHPVSTKLISSKGNKHKVTGNYFSSSLEETRVAFTKFVEGEEHRKETKVQLRKWTLGEIVTAIAGAGLFIRNLEEEPNHKKDDIGIPKTFTVVAEKL